MTEARRTWYCTTIDRPGGAHSSTAVAESLLEGVAERGKLWERGTTLRVRFRKSPQALQDRVIEAARAWLVPGVKLKIVPARPGEQAHIRVAFDEDGGSWSAVGNDSLLYHPSQPTMNLGWANLQTPEDDFNSVVIHEFGHALGLLHEHNHPKARIRWNKAAVNADLSGDPNFWDQATIDGNVFDAYDKSQVIVTNFDAASIMIYTIPATWTLDGQSFMPSTKLSAGDKEAIGVLYG